ncbi:PREDICTED: uncharacterized protein LOC109178940 [Ipomoea nil]|uniref:uncharacterized protein LOC109178940 n=1 Tax=Ipomoea nil TaxID=35883 RepID=UPI0009011562|nr:PREDICTED: uncharacterized protein LOC109178940 [Ipomoea nil]
MAQDRVTHRTLLRGPSVGGMYSLSAPSPVALLSAKTSAQVESILEQLSSTFKIQDLVLLSQRQYMTELLRKVGMESCKPLSTPMTTATTHSDADSSLLDDPTLYRQLVGSLMYLLITMPDLSFVVNRLCQFMHNPTQDNWAALKRVLRYIKGSLSLGLRLAASVSLVVHAFSDSD